MLNRRTAQAKRVQHDGWAEVVLSSLGRGGRGGVEPGTGAGVTMGAGAAIVR
ncbi:MAG TPA: hypothetical protein VGN66_04315 [Sphingomonas sp.]|nr:hypothetical protein [Sphingomonas sp.]